MKREIVKYPDRVLLEPAMPVLIEGVPYKNAESPDHDFRPRTMTRDEILAVITDLRDTAASVEWGKCVGLAAPQIGRGLRIFMANGLIYINPVITWYSPKVSQQAEGCYSLEKAKFNYRAQRSKSVDLMWQDLDGLPHTKRFHRFEAQVIQHEYDHLQGVLCGTSDEQIRTMQNGGKAQG